jgi:lipopolysaccharide/colanic/teichoic acid biosynthesis glycosyltransferase
MHIRPFAVKSFRVAEPDELRQRHFNRVAGVSEKKAAEEKPAENASNLIHIVPDRQGSWSKSNTKRFFDVFCVLLTLPIFFPILLAIAFAVRLTSCGPVLFTQERMGRRGHVFTILKFRTLKHYPCATRRAVTTVDNQQFTQVGPFLRRWKIDEFPQLFNVLAGDMSLVGPRPKMLQHQIAVLPYRPGLTGAATFAFAREEMILAHVPKHRLDDYYHEVILPAKHQLDMKYMANATFLTDLKLLFKTLLRLWDTSVIEDLLNAEMGGYTRRPGISNPTVVSAKAPIATRVDAPI